MYKVFFKDRTVFLGDDSAGTFKREGLYYRYGSGKTMEAVLKAFFRYDEIRELYLLHDDPENLWKDFRGLFVNINAAGGLVINSKGEILVIRRSGFWDLPKGKLEKNEEARAGALREVEEECGISGLKIEEEIHTSYHCYELKGDMVLKKTRWFIMKYNGNGKPEPQLVENITEAIWVKPSDLPEIIRNTYLSIIEVFKSADFL